MIAHLIKLIWNRKRSNMLMIIEIFFSFLVIFAIASISIFTYRNYNKPIGFEYQNVWSLSLQEVISEEYDSLSNSGDEPSEKNPEEGQVMHYKKLIYEYLKKYPQIEIYAASGPNVPYVFNSTNSDIDYEGQKTFAQIYHNDDHYADVVGLNVVEGRWFNKTDDASRLKPLVINQYVKDQLFKNENAVGKIIKFWDTEFQVVGVIEEYRQHGEFVKPDGAVFQRLDVNASDFWFSNILMKVKPGTGVDFEEQMIKEIGAIVPGWTLEVSSLERLRGLRKKIAWVPLVIIYSICGFLIINVALGLFGVLWYNISRRYSEIGLRRAIGSTAPKIQYQFLLEIWVLATFGILLGCLIAFQFPILNVFNISSGIYLLAIFISIIFLYALAAVCAWYPGRQAAKIEPAMALHEE